MSPTPTSFLITGGASGIGAATIASIATKPTSSTVPYITIVDQNSESGNALAKKLNSDIVKVQFIQADITDFAALKEAFKAAIRFSPSHTVDHVVANAGKHDTKVEPRLIKAATTAPAPSLETLDDPDIQPPVAPLESLNTLLTGQYYTAWLAVYYFRLPPLQKSETPLKSLTITASLAAYTDVPSTRPPYWMAKWGLRGLFHSTKQDMHKVGARMNLICPYWVKTGLTADLVANATTSAAIPGGWTDIEDVAAAMRMCIEDVSISQRSFGVFPKQFGTLDLGDDMEGLWGGTMIKKLLDAMGGEEAREANRKAGARE